MRKTYIEKMTDYMNRRITELNKVNFRVLSAPSLFSPSSSPYFLNNHDFFFFEAGASDSHGPFP